VIAIGSLAGNVSRNASSSRLSRWTASASLRFSPGRLFLFLNSAAPSNRQVHLDRIVEALRRHSS
jgi:hypothetical protein